VIDKLTPAQRIAGQIVSFVAPEAASIKQFAQLGLAGVLVNKRHGRRIKSYAQFAERLKAAWPAGVPAPMLMVDQEGGAITRIEDPSLTVFQPNSRIGQQKSATALAVVSEQGQAFGRALRQAEIHVDFAPVLDVNSNTNSRIIANLGRSYSSRPDVVGNLGRAMVLQLQASGIAATLKHFPGHGMVTADSHLALPITNISRNALQSGHIAPFVMVINDLAVRQDLLLVMTSHVLYRQLDSENPASLSKAITTDLLRQELGYQGVIITDALGMKALQGTIQSRIERALAAGADLALLDPGFETAVMGVVNALAGRLASDPAFESQNRAALRRILRLKRALGLLP
jgi:beta-N-acetylhexosaminidase